MDAPIRFSAKPWNKLSLGTNNDKKTMMNDLEAADLWNENEVYIEDLDPPTKGFSLFLFSLGKKWPAADGVRTQFIMLLFIGCLFMMLLPGSALIKPATQAPHPVSSASQAQQNCRYLVHGPTDAPWIDPGILHLQTGKTKLYVCGAFSIFNGEGTYASPEPYGTKTP